MKKRYMISTIGAIGAGALASYLLKDKESRAQVKEKIGHYIEGFTGNNEKKHSLLEDAGIPDQVDHQDLAQFENAKMVSEGSQYGVNYYNEVMEEHVDHNRMRRSAERTAE